MYGGYDSSRAAKTVVTALHAGGVTAAVWLLAGGLRTFGGWVGVDFPQAEGLRRALLIALSVIYFGRFLVVTFVTVKRTMAVPEAVTIGVWVIVIHVTMAFTGGTNPTGTGIWTVVGLALYLLGSYLNSGGRLRHLRHPGYLGDVTLLTGFALVTGTVSAFAIPLITAVMWWPRARQAPSEPRRWWRQDSDESRGAGTGDAAYR